MFWALTKLNSIHQVFIPYFPNYNFIPLEECKLSPYFHIKSSICHPLDEMEQIPKAAPWKQCTGCRYICPKYFIKMVKRLRVTVQPTTCLLSCQGAFCQFYSFFIKISAILLELNRFWCSCIFICSPLLPIIYNKLAYQHIYS